MTICPVDDGYHRWMAENEAVSGACLLRGMRVSLRDGGWRQEDAFKKKKKRKKAKKQFLSNTVFSDLTSGAIKSL